MHQLDARSMPAGSDLCDGLKETRKAGPAAGAMERDEAYVQGLSAGVIGTALELRCDISTIMQLLINRLGCDSKEAEQILRDYLTRHAQAGAHLE